MQLIFESLQPAFLCFARNLMSLLGGKRDWSLPGPEETSIAAGLAC